MKTSFTRFIFLFQIILICSISTPIFPQNRSIQFIEKPWQEILSLSKQQEKLIFLDGYTTWCGPCKWMASNMFTNDTIADLYNRNFICAHFDMEKGEGPQLSAKYEVKAYPTLLFINQNGEMVHKRVGAPQKVSDYIEMANVAVTPGEGLAAVQKKHQEGERSAVFMFKYFRRLQDAYSPVGEAVDNYISGIPENDYILPENWKIIYHFVNDMNSPAFIYLQTNQKGFSKKYSADSVNQKLFTVYLQSLALMPRNRNFTESEYNAVKLKIKNSGFPEADKVIFTADLYVYQMKGEIQKFLDLACNELDRFYHDDAEMLNQVAQITLQASAENKYLEKTAGWAKRCIELKKSPAYYDLYSQVMLKSGNRQEAIKYEQLAIDLAKKQKVDFEKFENNLKNLQKN